MFNKDSTIYFVLMMLLFIAGFIVFGNFSIFSAWQTSFTENAEIIDKLSLRFWIFGLLSLASLIALILHVTFKIKRVNKKFRESENKKSNSTTPNS